MPKSGSALLVQANSIQFGVKQHNLRKIAKNEKTVRGSQILCDADARILRSYMPIN